MTRRGLAVAVVAAALGGGVVGAQRPVFRAGIEVVAVDVAVTRGRTPVTGLGVADFRLLDNGVAQTIEAVGSATVPIDVTLVLDLAGSTSAEWPVIRADADRMRSRLDTGDRLRIVTAGAGAAEIVPLQESARPIPPAALAGGGMVTALHDAVFLALAQPVAVDRRHLVVVFTDGYDTWSILDGDRLPELAARGDAVMHAVITATPPSSPPPDAGTGGGLSIGPGGVITGQRLSRATWERRIAAWRASQRALFGAVDRSGGQLHHASHRTEAFEAILADFRSSYVLRYSPAGVAREGWHELAVSLTRRGTFTIRARKGYEVARQ
jgi:VWFA-related protein